MLGNWRRPTGWIAAYALVLQLLLGAVAGAQFSAHAADQNWSFFEICFGKGSADGALPDGKPAKETSKASGCAVCVNAIAAPGPEAPEFFATEFSVSTIHWVARDERTTPTAFSLSQRQRAPPFEA
jgi:hypothetical protein